MKWICFGVEDILVEGSRVMSLRRPTKTKGGYYELLEGELELVI